MTDHISWVLEVAILPGKLEPFRAVAADLIEKTRSEPGTLDYEWNLNHDLTICHIFERYENADALVTHVQSFGEFAHRFLEACRPVRFDVYGEPTGAVREALADLNPVYYSQLGGFSR